uniref:Uncharacterized protein n=1 Tax=Nelumbo nucifera TaxID=4432 RepID=A0A822YCM2_NELNU|nr:TPA_asm: hypothetical protein HUJ06_030203 [Nelumbo nucifera]
MLADYNEKELDLKTTFQKTDGKIWASTKMTIVLIYPEMDTKSVPDPIGD